MRTLQVQTFIYLQILSLLSATVTAQYQSPYAYPAASYHSASQAYEEPSSNYATQRNAGSAGVHGVAAYGGYRSYGSNTYSSPYASETQENAATEWHSVQPMMQQAQVVQNAAHAYPAAQPSHAAPIKLVQHHATDIVHEAAPAVYAKKPVIVEKRRTECPNGSTARADGLCVITTEATLKCPAGFKEKDGHCAKTTKEAVKYTCQYGEVEKDKCKITRERELQCSEGYQKNYHNKCIKYEKATMACPDGFTLKGYQCMKETTYRAMAKCPHGYELAPPAECFKLVPRRPHCPDGFALDYRFNRCKKVTTKIPAECPKDYKPFGQLECQKVTRSTPEFYCPAGMKLKDGACVDSIEMPSQCPTGFVKGENNKCQRGVELVLTCPEDSTLYGGNKCSRRTEHKKYGECPAGYDLIDNKCKKVQIYPTYMECPEGHLEGDVCVTQSTVSPRYACPPGFELVKAKSGPQCARTTSYDCSIQVSEQTCSMPDFIANLAKESRASASNKRMLGGKSYKLKTVGVPIDDATRQGKGAVCRQTTRKLARTCLKQQGFAAEFVCPALARPTHDRKCEIDSPYEPVPFCKDGRLDKLDRCIKVTTAPAAWHCPAGQDAGGLVCLEHELFNAEYGCPKGTKAHFDFHGHVSCYEQVEPVKPDAQVVKKPAKLVCSSGSLHGDECMETERIPRGLTCPKGAYEAEYSADHCTHVVDLVTPEPERVTQAPTYSCKDFSSPQGDQCKATDYAKPAPKCTTNGKMIDGKCWFEKDLERPKPDISYEPANRHCVRGVQEGDTCNVEEYKKIEVDCPEGFEQNTSPTGFPECVKFLVPKIIAQ